MQSILNVPINVDEFATPAIEKKSLFEYESEILESMRAQGITEIPAGITYDSEIHRFGKDGDCWYSASIISDMPFVNFGDWHDKATWGTFRASYYQQLDETRRREIDEVMRVQREAAEKEQRRKNEEAAAKAVRIWENGSPADHRTNIYLDAKNLNDAHGSRTDMYGNLILPVYGPDKRIMTLEFIAGPGKGNKHYLSGGKTQGGFWWIGNPEAQSVYLCEGFATAASINEASGKTVYISYSAGQLTPVARMLSSWGRTVTIIADNDASGTGQREAEKAARACGGKMWVVPNNGDTDITDANDYQNKAGNLKDILPIIDGRNETGGLDFVWAQDLIGKPAPVRWLIKNWIPQQSVGMIYGPPGGGKTNFILDVACTLSTASMDRESPTRWADGRKCRRSKIVYLCGEGVDGLKGRLNAWMIAHDTANIGYFGIIKRPVDLDVLGGVDMAIATIREQIGDSDLDMLIIDTVNRYMSGDENSAQDTRMFLNQTARFRETFGCTVVYIHHSGKNDTDITSPRGSSAFTGAMDFLIAVYEDKDRGIRVARPTKMKDGELRQPIFGSIDGIPLGEGWDDPDDDEHYTAPVWRYVPEEELRMAEQPKKENDYDYEIVEAFADRAVWNDRTHTFYLDKDQWRTYLKTAKGMASSTASNYLKGGVVTHAVRNGRLHQDSSGWTMVDQWMIEQVMNIREAQQ